MFEHLGHIPELNSKKDVRDFKVYFSLLFFAVLTFVVSWIANQGPVTSAYSGQLLNVSISANYLDQQVAADMPRTSVFDFFIKTEVDNVKLDKLKIYTNGLYDLETLAKLKLFHNNTQLGSISQIDEAGSIYFDINNYQLDKGNNNFQLILNPNTDVKVGDIFKFALVDNLSVALTYKDQTYLAQGDWPVESGTISFVDHGSLFAYNNLAKKEFLTLAQYTKQIASFSLASQAEVADLQQIIIDYKSDIDLSGSNFMLISDNQVVATAKANNSQIIFNLNKLSVVGINKNINFDIVTAGLPVGMHNFYLKNIKATGSSSGQNLFLLEDINLSTVYIINNYLEFNTAQADNVLSAAWNVLSAIDLKAKGDNVSLDKLTWLVEEVGVDINQIEVWVDNNLYQTGINFIDNKIAISWDEPLVIDKDGVNIKLLAFADDLQNKAKLQGHLLTDKDFVDQDDIFSSNIIWSSDNIYYNSYLLPHLPLLPNILVN